MPCEQKKVILCSTDFGIEANKACWCWYSGFVFACWFFSNCVDSWIFPLSIWPYLYQQNKSPSPLIFVIIMIVIFFPLYWSSHPYFTNVSYFSCHLFDIGHFLFASTFPVVCTCWVVSLTCDPHVKRSKCHYVTEEVNQERDQNEMVVKPAVVESVFVQIWFVGVINLCVCTLELFFYCC